MKMWSWQENVSSMQAKYDSITKMAVFFFILLFIAHFFLVWGSVMRQLGVRVWMYSLKTSFILLTNPLLSKERVAALMDLVSAVFDSLRCRFFLLKLHAFSIHSDILSWIESFLFGCFFRLYRLSKHLELDLAQQWDRTANSSKCIWILMALTSDLGFSHLINSSLV